MTGYIYRKTYIIKIRKDGQFYISMLNPVHLRDYESSIQPTLKDAKDWADRKEGLIW